MLSWQPNRWRNAGDKRRFKLLRFRFHFWRHEKAKSFHSSESNSTEEYYLYFSFSFLPCFSQLVNRWGWGSMQDVSILSAWSFSPLLPGTTKSYTQPNLIRLVWVEFQSQTTGNIWFGCFVSCSFSFFQPLFQWSNGGLCFEYVTIGDWNSKKC